MNNEAQHIADLIRRGSPEGFRKASTVFGPRIFALALEITGNRYEAEEVTSDCLMQVFRSIDSFNPAKGSLAGWVLRIAHNLAISAVRRRKPEISAVDIPDVVDTTNEDETEEVVLAREAITTLSPEEREIIQLYYYDNLPLAEIGGIVGTPPPSLAVRLQRIRQKIKQYIQTHNGR